MKTICLDYDGSYTDFPDLFETIITRSKTLGYKIILATMRYTHEEDIGLTSLREKHNIEIYFTNRKAKLPYLESLGIRPDLWIDDKPYWLLNDG